MPVVGVVRVSFKRKGVAKLASVFLRPFFVYEDFVRIVWLDVPPGG